MPAFPQPPESYTLTHISWQTPTPGWLEFDAVSRQSIDRDGEVTDHPVDEGADITDHYRRYNTPLVLEATITNSPIRLPNTHAEGAQATQDIRIVEIPAPLFPGAPTTLGGFDVTRKKRVQLSTLVYTPALDRMNAVYEELAKIQEEVRLVTVSLGRFRDYPNMILKRFSVDRDNTAYDAMPLVLEFRQVSFAKLADSDLEVPVEEPVKPRSNKRSDKGKRGSTEVDTEQNVSINKRIVQGVRNLLGI